MGIREGRDQHFMAHESVVSEEKSSHDHHVNALMRLPIAPDLFAYEPSKSIDDFRH
jgi:hypothetical protein